MANDEIRSMREILRDIEKTQIETKTLVSAQKERSEDHEKRIRSLESSKNKLVAGVAVAGSTGLWASIKSLFGF